MLLSELELLTNKVYSKEQINMIIADASSNEPSKSVRSMGTVIGLCKSYEAMRNIAQMLLNITKEYESQELITHNINKALNK